MDMLKVFQLNEIQQLMDNKHIKKSFKNKRNLVADIIKLYGWIFTCLLWEELKVHKELKIMNK